MKMVKWIWYDKINLILNLSYFFIFNIILKVCVWLEWVWFVIFFYFKFGLEFVSVVFVVDIVMWLLNVGIILVLNG